MSFAPIETVQMSGAYCRSFGSWSCFAPHVVAPRR